MNEEKIEQIKSALREVVQLLAKRGTALSKELKAMLAQVMEHSASRIQELRSQNPEPELEPAQPPETPNAPAIPEGVDLLWILSNSDPNAFVNYLRTYPGEGLKDLVNDPNRLVGVIQHLQSTSPFEAPQVDQDGIPGTKYLSSNVIGMKYDPSHKSLLVKFFGDGKPDPIYQYSGVPPQIFQLLEHGNALAKTSGSNSRGSWWKFKSPSIGSAVNQYLKKGGYGYQRVS